MLNIYSIFVIIIRIKKHLNRPFNRFNKDSFHLTEADQWIRFLCTINTDTKALLEHDIWSKGSSEAFSQYSTSVTKSIGLTNSILRTTYNTKEKSITESWQMLHCGIVGNAILKYIKHTLNLCVCVFCLFFNYYFHKLFLCFRPNFVML